MLKAFAHAMPLLAAMVLALPRGADGPTASSATCATHTALLNSYNDTDIACGARRRPRLDLFSHYGSSVQAR